ncbi:hypothetical protein [Nocardia sp. BMG51109]|uniref:hypothetical protein n=1 Tax=Nocardia sp. BMG51109 TaxID=1056816 RepID=UPI0004B577FD|nr:hypothetical protein [Nocardia sp. BMG51109]
MSEFASLAPARCTIESAARAEADSWSLAQLEALTARSTRQRPAADPMPWWRRVGREAWWAVTIAMAEFRATRVRKQLSIAEGAR